MLRILGLMKPLPENLRGDVTIIDSFDTKECYTKPKAVKRWKKKEEKNYDVESL